jgi:hypothetical protein
MNNRNEMTKESQDTPANSVKMAVQGLLRALKTNEATISSNSPISPTAPSESTALVLCFSKSLPYTETRRLTF